MARLDRAASIEDLRLLARRRLPKGIFEFIDGGAGTGTTLHNNMDEFGAWRLMPRCGIDVSARSQRTAILGHEAAQPLVFAPTGFAGLFWPKGECLAARAAEAAGLPFCLSTNSVASMEEVARAVPGGDRWFQLYFLKDEGLMRSILERAKAGGYRVLCLTVDLAVQGRRDNDIRNAFTVPFRPRLDTVAQAAMRPAWSLGYLRNPVTFGNFEDAVEAGSFTSVAAHVAKLCDASVTWDGIGALIAGWDGPVVVKGILDPGDARRAVDLGADAVIVSNHGGRQLDRAPSAIAALPGIVAAVGDDAEVILDGGVRRGSDIAIALGLGASSCMIGRAFLWGLSAAGGPGIARTLAILREELDIAMALMGVTDVAGLRGRAVAG